MSFVRKRTVLSSAVVWCNRGIRVPQRLPPYLGSTLARLPGTMSFVRKRTMLFSAAVWCKWGHYDFSGDVPPYLVLHLHASRHFYCYVCVSSPMRS
jgi:hypothetical protein